MDPGRVASVSRQTHRAIQAALRRLVRRLTLAMLGVAITLLVVNCSERDEPSSGAQRPAVLPFRVIAQGIDPSLAVRREAIGVFADRSSFVIGLPELEGRLPRDFDFSRNQLLAWVRPAPGPLGAGRPAVTGISGLPYEYGLEIDWRSRCEAWAGTAFALLEIPALAGAEGGWAASHHVPPLPGHSTLDAWDWSRGGFREPENFGRQVRVRLLDSRESADELWEEAGFEAEAAFGRLRAVDYREWLALGVFTISGSRPAVTSVQRDGPIVTVYASDATQLGPIPGVTSVHFQFVLLSRDDGDFVTEWRFAPDNSPEGTNCG
jgi:hypothetical protein